MQIKTLLLTPLLATMTSAAPSAAQTFELLALRSGSAMHFSAVQASTSHLSLNLAKQGASCDRGVTNNQATFRLSGDELFLYKTDNPPQQIYVDRSGMGQGVLGYTTGAEPTPRNGERKGWAVDKNGDLTFKGQAFIACPSDKKTWAVWLDAGVAQPGGNSGCVGFSARVVNDAKPVGCLYTQHS